MDKRILFSVEEGGRLLSVERRTFTVPLLLTRFLFDVASPETQGHGELAPHLPRGGEDSISLFTSAPGKEGA